ncbi:MAG: hypothetical protein Q8R28_12605 [Dehalococcoidia bacterium]|nr:hypothetical protein [Dehalococcoidia bacterium]
MDADALIKLTKCSVKEEVVRRVEVAIPQQVKVETVDEARALGYPDAVVTAENIRAGRLKVVDPDPGPESTQAELFPAGGDRALFEAFRGGHWDAVVSDDRKLLRLLRAFGVPVITPSALLVALTRSGALSRDRAKAALEALSPLVSQEEYASALLALEALTIEAGDP